MTVAVRRLFNRSWSVLWATTYTCGVVSFDEYFLGQLRPDALNVTILADLDALAETWSALIETAGLSRVRRINRDYLLRPVAWHRYSFHPKTYLFGNENSGVLLVGSGNADLRGLVAGHEVFAQFRLDDSAGAAAIAVWRDWMSRLVRLLADPPVETRWADARARLPWLNALRPAAASPLVFNLDEPMVDRFLIGVEPPVDELHCAAPFWDAPLTALTALVERTRPHRIHLYLGAGARIDGKRLLAFLGERKPDASIWTYTEPRFVHAKLVAAITGGSARLLSGSANLSYVGLLASGGDGNVEAGVVVDCDAASARELFTPPGLGLRSLESQELASLTPEPRSEEAQPPLHLLRCQRLVDGHLSLAITPAPPSCVFLRAVQSEEPAVDLEVARSDGTELYAELSRARTIAPWDSTAILVHLVDAQGGVLSNAVPIDDPDALAAALRAHDDADRGLLRDLEWDELDSPVGRILDELQASCVFEPRRAKDKRRLVVTAEQAVESDPSFWQRLGALDLDAIPPGHRSRFDRGHLDTDPIFSHLHALLIQAPFLPELRPLKPLVVSDEELDDPDALRRWWAMETRQRVRVFNVLRRWFRAVRDPGLLAIDPMITVHNYRALLQALGELWRGDGEGGRYFDEDHLHQLLEILLESLVGEQVGHKGALVISEPAVRDRMIADLRDHGATIAVAALLFDVLRPERRSRLALALRWQPLLRLALAQGVVEVSHGPIADVIRWAAEYVDEAGWRRQVLQRHGVDAYFSKEALADGYEYQLVLASVSSLITDPRALMVVQEALRFRPASGIVVAADQGGDRVSIREGEHVFALVGGKLASSREPVAVRQVAELPGGSVLGDLLQPGSKDEPITA